MKFLILEDPDQPPVERDMSQWHTMHDIPPTGKLCLFQTTLGGWAEWVTAVRKTGAGGAYWYDTGRGPSIYDSTIQKWMVLGPAP